jgi:transposase
MAILNVGIDLAKNVFAQRGQVDLRRPSVPRAKLHALVAALPPCTIGMEACSGAHHWAWLGLVPGQYSSGGTTRLGRITKAGDAYLRGLLVMGARAVLNAAGNKTDSISRWATNIALRRGYWLAKRVIQAHAVDAQGRVVTRRALRRDAFPPSLPGARGQCSPRPRPRARRPLRRPASAPARG